MRLWRAIRALLEVGGATQLILSLVGTFGLNLMTFVTVIALARPNSVLGYLFALAAFAAVTPLTFPLSAVFLNFGLTKVEASRQKNIFDSPMETARKTLDQLIADAKMLSESLPQSFDEQTERDYHQDRKSHYLFTADGAIARTAGEWATLAFSLDDREESWRLADDSELEYLRWFYAAAVNVLNTLRDDLPYNRTKWLRRSYSCDITCGMSLIAFLRDAGPSSDEHFGCEEFERWVTKIYGSMKRDNPAEAHPFAQGTYSTLSTRAERIAYVQNRIEILDGLWKALPSVK